MLNFLRKLFRKPEAAADAFAPLANAPAEPLAPLATVATAQLSLSAILEGFPDDLKAAIQQQPTPYAKVALPLPTILKQLPGGAVRMSFASIHRQAPPNTFKPGGAEEKRMITVPLAEVFRCIPLDLLHPRDDQRPYKTPEAYIDLFGDRENPFAVAPLLVELPPTMAEENADLVEAGSLPAFAEAEPETIAAPRMMAAPAELSASLTLAMSEPAEEYPATTIMPDRDALILPLNQLAAAWPEPIKSEAAALNGVSVALPAEEIAAGLTRGRVTFSWAQIRQWTLPPTREETAASESTELVLPLRVVAPAFLKHSNVEQKRKPLAIDADIPELFDGGENARKFTSVPRASEVPEPVEQPAAASATLRFSEPAAAPEKPREETFAFAPEPTPMPAQKPATLSAARTIGELFGVRDKAEWAPNEIVQHLTKLPQIDGAIIALQEGFVVAHQLPDPLRGEVFAAFLPQIFARLNQYTREMNLPAVDDLLTNHAGRPCQMFRLGEVFFAVLGKPGVPLPIPELRLCAQELSR